MQEYEVIPEEHLLLDAECKRTSPQEIPVSRVLEFDAAHRLVGHESKCRFLHGHRYRAVIQVQASRLDSQGRSLDFSAIKEGVGGWIDRFWDHNVLLNPSDPLLGEMSPNALGRDPFLMPRGFENPTAENMACVLFLQSALLLNNTGLRVIGVRLYETPNCWADITHRNLLVRFPE